MTAIYGHRWVSTYGTKPTKDDTTELTIGAATWSAGLTGITDKQIALGLQACVFSDDGWPPSLPEFRQMCLSIPTFAEIATAVQRYLGAHANERDATALSPFAFTLLQRMDVYRFRMATSDGGTSMLKLHYEAIRDEVLKGAELASPPEHVLTHDAKPRAPANPETVEANIRKLAELFHEEPQQVGEP